MSFGLAFTIVFGVIFSIALFFGFLYEKELKEFETVLVRFIKLKRKAKKMGLTPDEYVNMKRSQRKSAEPDFSNVINLNEWVA